MLVLKCNTNIRTKKIIVFSKCLFIAISFYRNIVYKNVMSGEGLIIIQQTINLIFKSSYINPDKIRLRSSFREILRKQEADISDPPKPEDHPNVTELRRRLLTMIEEAAECNFI
jgi:hypothetical protein